MKADDLIKRMATGTDPVRRLSVPWKRVLRWFVVALPGVARAAMPMSPRDDLSEQFADIRIRAAKWSLRA